jgi:hypothetical protein
VLAADDADQLAGLEHRRVEHRRDPERAEVAVGELGGVRVGPRVVGGDDPARRQRLPVAGELLAAQHVAAADLVGRELVAALAHQRVARRREHPVADPLDGERVRAQPQRLLDRGRALGRRFDAEAGQRQPRGLERQALGGVFVPHPR